MCPLVVHCYTPFFPGFHCSITLFSLTIQYVLSNVCVWGGDCHMPFLPSRTFGRKPENESDPVQPDSSVLRWLKFINSELFTERVIRYVKYTHQTIIQSITCKSMLYILLSCYAPPSIVFDVMY